MNTYFTLPTAIGRVMISNAIALNQQVDLTHMAIGDGNGQPVIPNEQMVELPGEKYRAPISDTQINPDDPTQFYVDLVVPQSVGGWVGNCVGVYASNGALFAVANIPAAPKPIISEGAGRELTVRIYLAVENASAVNIVVNPTMVLATRDWAQREFWKKIDLVKQSNTSDLTPGRLLLTGAFGIGIPIYVSNIDFNAEQFCSFSAKFYVANSSANSPNGSDGWLEVDFISPGNCRQTFKTVANRDTAVRRQIGGVWGAWTGYYHLGNILGHVSQQAGSPTGAVFEQGENPNGFYIKLASRSMLEFKTISVNAIAGVEASVPITWPSGDQVAGLGAVLTGVSNTLSFSMSKPPSYNASSFNFLASVTQTYHFNLVRHSFWF